MVEAREEEKMVNHKDMFADPPRVVAMRMRREFTDPFYESACERAGSGGGGDGDGDHEGDVSPRTLFFRGENSFDEDFQPSAEGVFDGFDEVNEAVRYNSQEEELSAMYQELSKPNSWDAYVDEECMSGSSDSDHPLEVVYHSLPSTSSLDLEDNHLLSDNIILDICTDMNVEALVDDLQHTS